MEGLGIDAHGGKSVEPPASAAANCRSEYAFEPEFKSFHELDHSEKGLFVESRGGVVHDVVGPVFVAAFFTARAFIEAAAGLRTRKVARILDGASDVLCNRRRELHKFPTRALQGEAMFVFSTGRIRSERGNADAVFALNGLGIPLTRRAVGFRRQPAFDVPAIHGWIFRFQPQFNTLPHQSARFAVGLEVAGDPREAVPAPHGAVIRFSETVQAGGAS